MTAMRVAPWARAVSVQDSARTIVAAARVTKDRRAAALWRDAEAQVPVDPEWRWAM